MEINGEDELVPFGNFIIQKPDSEETEEKTEFTGYDYMIKFNATYTDRVTYPITAGELFEDVCDQVGVECGSTEFVNSDYEISGNPFTNNEDCKTVLSNLAQLAGGFAHIGRDNKCYITTLSVEEITSLTVQDITAMTVAEVDALSVSSLTGTGSTESGSSLAEGIDGNNYFDFSKNNEFGPVNCVILSLSSIEGENTTLQDDESIEEYGTTEITIEDNYFLTSEEEREKVITNIYNALNGLTYLPFKASYYGFPYLDVGDAILIYDTDDNYYISYVFSHTFTYNGAYSGELETKALTETQTAYKNTNDIKTKFKRTERSIDKINGIIEDVIEEVDENSEKISQHTQDIDSITDKISSIVDYIRTASQTNYLYISGDEVPTGEGYITSFIIYGVENFTSKNITICASTKPKGYGDNLNIDTEDSENILTEDDENLVVGASTYYTRIVELNLSDILREYTDNDGTIYYDTLEITQDGTIIVTKRIGVDDDGNLYLLDTEIITTLSETAILPTYEDGTYYYVLELDALSYYAEYINNNDYVTRIEMNSSISQTAEEINLTVSKKVDETEIISKINQSAEEIQIQADKISLEGKEIDLTSDEIIIDSTYFSVDKEGNAVASSLKISNGNISISSTGEIDIYDSEDTNIILSLNYDGMHIYDDGETVGHIGTYDVTTTGLKGLAFELDQDGDAEYMLWTTVYTKNGLKYHYAKLTYQSSTDEITVGVPLVTNAGLECHLFHGTQYYFGTSGGVYATHMSTTISDITYYGISFSDNVKSGFAQFTRGWVYFNTTNFYVGGYQVQLNTSDGRLKHDIKKTKINALDRINQIKHRQFIWNKDDKEEQIGYIAQELEKIDENYVIKNEQYDESGNVVDYLYQINLLPIVATSTKAISELYEKVEKQEVLIQTLLGKLEMQDEIISVCNNEELENEKVDYGNEIIYTDNEKFIKETTVEPKTTKNFDFVTKA